MTRKELIDRLLTASSKAYDEREATAVSRLIADRVFGLSRADLALEPSRKVDFSKLRSSPEPTAEVPENAPDTHYFDRLLADISAAKPIQYIIGEAEFCGLQLAVGQGVLIPRPETEELVAWVLEDFSRDLAPEVLDVGAGSGAIAIALAKSLPQARVTAIDVSEEALRFARQNDSRHEAGVEILQADIFNFSPIKKFDVIVSNPPYIPERERVTMHRNVVEHEPSEALFVPDDDPLKFYRAIARLGVGALKPGGALFFEIHPPFADEIVVLLRSEGFCDATVREDVFGRKRMVVAHLKPRL